jgi:hypothetical protein
MRRYTRRTKAERHAGTRLEPEGMSWCSGHQAWHPAEAFAPDRYKEQRYQRYCLAYHADYMKTWRAKKRAEGAPVR